MHKIRDLFIVVVQVGAVKIYVAAVYGLRKKERGGQNRMKLSLQPPPPQVNPNVLFCRFLLKSHPVLDQTQGFGAVFSS
jgi:hypothetical protein